MTGIVGFSPSTADADNVGNFFYDIEMEDAAGDFRTVDDGKYVLKQDITK